MIFMFLMILTNLLGISFFFLLHYGAIYLGTGPHEETGKHETNYPEYLH